MLSVKAQNELVANPDEEGFWQADGDDPFFLIRFGFFRARFVAIRLNSPDLEIQPKLYVNQGWGFREQDALQAGTGSNFLIVADVGAFGTICSIRLDPSNEPCRLSLCVTELRSEGDLESYILDQHQKNPAMVVTRFSRLSRFWKKIPSLGIAKSRSAIASYVSRAEALSDCVAVQCSDARAPWLSIVVPVFNAPPRFLNELVASFKQQGIEGVQLILSDDGSDSQQTRDWLDGCASNAEVLVIRNKNNRGIALATNSGINAAQGDWVTLLDHDDVIAPNGLRVVKNAIDTCPHAKFFYTDELVVDEALQPIGLMLKPAYDPVLLSGVNYVNHFSVYKRERLLEIGLLRAGYEGSQDYDLLLRYFNGLDDDQIVHVPFPAYWWRRTGATYSRRYLQKATDSARRALRENFEKCGKCVEVTGALTDTLHRIQFLPTAKRPMVSIIIPNKDAFKLISNLLRGIYERTGYTNFEVLVIDNGTSDPATIFLYKEYAKRYPSFSYYVEKAPFNFSRAINQGIARAAGDHYLLLNNDVEIVESDWLDEMVNCLSYENAGVVGAKLLYPNHRIQHAGVISGFGGLAGHWYLNKPANFGGPMNRLHVRSSMTCVTGAAMLISGECARQVGPWDEEQFAVAYNDVDYCLRAYKRGFRIIWTPFACLIHHESVSRGSDRHGENRSRFEREKENLRRIHQTDQFDDPACHPGYSRDRSDPKITPLALLPGPREWFASSRALQTQREHLLTGRTPRRKTIR